MARPTLLSLVLVSVVLGSMHAAAQRGREQQKLTQRFDANKSGVLERKERDAARAWLKENPNPSGRRRRGPRGGRSGSTEPRGPGPRVSPNEVKNFTGKGLYNPSILRTLFLTFDSDDWEEELAAFRSTDVEVPATLLVDGKSYKKIGVRFRGNTSYRNVAAGQKRSFNLSIDLVNNKQRLGGYKTLNLLNCHSDPSFLREALHALIGRKFAPMPRTNLVHVVINGRSWGIYANVQQGNKDYQRDAFGTGKGARWRVPPDFSGRSGLSYLGENPLEYERRYKAKSGVDDEALLRLADLCYTLTQTSMEERREQLPAMLDIDGALWFLAIDNALLDGDGYLARASDYVLYMDPTGVFHLITYDNNELLRGGARGGPGRGGPGRGGPPPGSGDPGGRRRPPPGGNQRGGRRGGPGGRLSPEQSPLAGADRDDRPLLQKLLEVPGLELAEARACAGAIARDDRRCHPRRHAQALRARGLRHLGRRDPQDGRETCGLDHETPRDRRRLAVDLERPRHGGARRPDQEAESHCPAQRRCRHRECLAALATEAPRSLRCGLDATPRQGLYGGHSSPEGRGADPLLR